MSRTYRAFQLRYRNDLEGFATDCFNMPGGKAWRSYQRDLFKNIPLQMRSSWRGGRGTGKSAPAAVAVLWFALTRDGAEDWKVLTTAGGFRQLEQFLWPEVHLWARRLRWSMIGRKPFTGAELLDMEIKLSTGRAFALNSDDPDLIEGAHADQVLLVIDEAKAVSDASYNALQGSLSTGECYELSLSTGGETTGWFNAIHSCMKGFENVYRLHIKIDVAVAEGQVTIEWVETMRSRWGETSALYQNQVLGEFANQSKDSVIPLAWVMAAVQRGRDLLFSAKQAGKAPDWGDFVCAGADVSDGGGDENTIALRHRRGIREVTHDAFGDPMVVAGRLVGMLSVYRRGCAVVDGIGCGAGTVRRLRELRIPVVSFIASEAVDDKDATGMFGFKDRRARAWWRMREILDPSNPDPQALPDDALLIGDLTAPRWKLMSNAKIQVESKDDLKKSDRLGRSTDSGDAVVHAYDLEVAPPGGIRSQFGFGGKILESMQGGELEGGQRRPGDSLA